MKTQRVSERLDEFWTEPGRLQTLFRRFYFLHQNVCYLNPLAGIKRAPPRDFQCQNIHYRAQWGTTLSLRAP